jgi:diaminopimelate decarboxylase
VTSSPASGVTESDLPHQLLDAIRDIPTPFYVVDLARVRRRAEGVRAAVECTFPRSTVAYPYKVNPLAAVAGPAVAVYGAAEVATAEELDLAVEHGASITRCLVGGAGKPGALLARAMREGATLKIDSIAELRRLEEVWPCTRVHPQFEMLLRAALPVDAGWSRFGLTPEEIGEVTAHAHAWDPHLRGVSFHVGTNIQDPGPYLDATRQVLPIVEGLAARVSNGARPVLDVGGGFPSCPDEDVTATVERYLSAIAELLDEHGLSVDDFDIVCEPGRITADRAGYLVATLVETHTRNGVGAVLVDAGNTLAGGSWSPVGPGRSVVFVADGASLPQTCDVYGNLCYENDVVASAAAVVEHDHLDQVAIIGDVGGYRLAAAAPWMQQIPAVHALVDGQLELVREPLRLRTLT